MKNMVANLLKEKNYDRLIGLAGEKRKVIRYLISLLYDQDDLTRWRAVEALGLVVSALAAQKTEAARDIVRRLFWSLNDESGSIGWTAPETIGEIIRNRPDLFGEYISMLLSHLDDPAFTAGVLWAAGRIAERKPELLKDAVPEFIPLLDHVNPVIRGYAAWAIGMIDWGCARDRLETIGNDDARPVKAGRENLAGRLKALGNDAALLRLYEKGELRTKTVGEIAAGALSQMLSQ